MKIIYLGAVEHAFKHHRKGYDFMTILPLLNEFFIRNFLLIAFCYRNSIRALMFLFMVLMFILVDTHHRKLSIMAIECDKFMTHKPGDPKA